MAKKKAEGVLEVEPAAPMSVVEHVELARLKPHPRNYRMHPQEQIDHIVKSIEEHGFYRNVVVANDYTILAGHGVVQAVQSMGLFGPAKVPVIKLPIGPDDPRALKVLTGDNELGKLAESDDRVLTGLLQELAQAADLGGTGFDVRSLSALVFVSRPVEEVADKNEANEWVGMPEYDDGTMQYILSMLFLTREARDEFIAQAGVKVSKKMTSGKIWSAWWPPIPRMKRQQEVLWTDAE